MVQSKIHCSPAHLKGLSPSSQPGLLLRMLAFQLVSPLAHTHTTAWCLGPSPCLHGAAASSQAVSNPPTRGFTVPPGGRMLCTAAGCKKPSESVTIS